MAKTTKTKHTVKKDLNGLLLSRKTFIVTALLLLTIYVFLPQLGKFKNSFATVMHADIAYLLLALVLIVLTYFTAAATYVWLAYFKLKYWRTVNVQVADGFTNRLLPAGVGGLAISALYLIKQAGNKVKAGYIAGLVNTLGFIGHVILALVLIIWSPAPLSSLFRVHITNSEIIFIGGLVLIIILAAISLKQLRRLTRQAVQSVTSDIYYSLKRPLRLVLALLSSMATTMCNVLALYACCLALNVHISLLQVFIVLTATVLGIVLTPTPGGLGGAETGLTASLIVVGVNAHQALSVALVFRFLTYWLPILPGLISFRFVLGKKYLAYNG